MSTCTPGCRNCAAADRLYALARVVEETGDTAAADVLMRLASDGVGRKTALGNRMAATVLGDHDELERLRAQRDAVLALVDEMHDAIHAAAHQPKATWGTVAVYIAAHLRKALGEEPR